MCVSLCARPIFSFAEQDTALADGMRGLKWGEEEEEEREQSVGVSAEGRMEDDGWEGEGLSTAPGNGIHSGVAHQVLGLLIVCVGSTCVPID